MLSFSFSKTSTRTQMHLSTEPGIICAYIKADNRVALQSYFAGIHRSINNSADHAAQPPITLQHTHIFTHFSTCSLC